MHKKHSQKSANDAMPGLYWAMSAQGYNTFCVYGEQGRNHAGKDTNSAFAPNIISWHRLSF
jgi:hypothetical protein